MKRKKYFSEEYAFEFIWLNADREGIWRGDAAELAAEFEVSEEASDLILSDLCEGRKIEKLDPGAYSIVNWREKDYPNEEPFEIVQDWSGGLGSNQAARGGSTGVTFDPPAYIEPCASRVFDSFSRACSTGSVVFSLRASHASSSSISSSLAGRTTLPMSLTL